VESRVSFVGWLLVEILWLVMHASQASLKSHFGVCLWQMKHQIASLLLPHKHKHGYSLFFIINQQLACLLLFWNHNRAVNSCGVRPKLCYVVALEHILLLLLLLLPLTRVNE